MEWVDKVDIPPIDDPQLRSTAESADRSYRRKCAAGQQAYEEELAAYKKPDPTDEDIRRYDDARKTARETYRRLEAAAKAIRDEVVEAAVEADRRARGIQR